MTSGLAEFEDRVLGCLIGGAMGDALGAPVEFMTTEQILAKYGRGGIRSYDVAYGIRGAITDDTQMMIRTGVGISSVPEHGGGPKDILDSIWEQYQEWYTTQMTVSDLRRAPGNTCLSALAGGVPGSIAQPLNDSKGCGGVMRIAPIATLEMPFTMGCRVAALTHGHPSGYLSAGYLADLLADLISGIPLSDAVQSGFELLKDAEGGEETLDSVERAWKLAVHLQLKPRGVYDLPSLGEGWTGEEALAIGLYCALVAPDFKTGVRLAVNHGGDSDSTGMISGNILGAIHGCRALPGAWHNFEGTAGKVLSMIGRDLARRVWRKENR